MGRKFGSPAMSDQMLLVSVEDMINMAMGPPNKNKVNYKLIQTILHILASQMRMLEQRVEIRIADQPPGASLDTAHKSPRKVETSITESYSGQSPRQSTKERKEEQARMQAEKAERAVAKDMERRARSAQKKQEKASRAASMERKREEKFAEKEREEEERAVSTDREKIAKEKQKYIWASTQEKERESRSTETGHGKEVRADSKEKGKGEKDSTKIERAALKDREKTGKVSTKDKTTVDIDKEREIKAAKNKRAASKEAENTEEDKERSKKDSAKNEKASTKEKDKSKNATGIERDIEDRADAKAAKQDQRDKEKYMKDKEGTAKTTRKEQEWVEKDQEKSAIEGIKRGKMDKMESTSTIAITESRSRGSIVVVTRSQFELLEARVKELVMQAAPLPVPALPDNERLRAALAEGTASLTDTMEAMQVSARVQAAEQAIGRMGELLTQLAAAGALPAEIASQLRHVRQELGRPGTAGGETDEKMLAYPPSSGVVARSVSSRVSGAGDPDSKVTHSEMDAMLRSLGEELKQKVHQLTSRTAAAADNATIVCKSIAEKMDTAMQLDGRISKLHSLATDYAEQLTGLDAGLGTQMQGFQEQISQMRTDLGKGLAQLELANTNAETAAVMELTERYEGLVSELEHTLELHNELTSHQTHLADKLHVLLEAVEILREQKADRDEVEDGLRDKADNSRLDGLLTEKTFEDVRKDLEDRLELFHEKFRRQDLVWMSPKAKEEPKSQRQLTEDCSVLSVDAAMMARNNFSGDLTHSQDAVKDVHETMSTKAELIQLVGLRDDILKLLKDLDDRCKMLAQALGDPKAALITRLVSRGAMCGACMVPTLMEPVDVSSGRPAPLPAVRSRRHPLADSSDRPCLTEWPVPAAPDHRTHACNRWVGGSHTLLCPAVRRLPTGAGPLGSDNAPKPTNKYTGYGDDGRMYLMEEELLPCVECNPLNESARNLADGPPLMGDGSGDRAMVMENGISEPDTKAVIASDDRKEST